MRVRFLRVGHAAATGEKKISNKCCRRVFGDNIGVWYYTSYANACLVAVGEELAKERVGVAKADPIACIISGGLRGDSEPLTRGYVLPSALVGSDRRDEAGSLERRHDLACAREVEHLTRGLTHVDMHVHGRAHKHARTP